MKKIELWKFINDKLKSGGEVVLMVTAESSKSSPGRPGFKMAVSSDGDIKGTIGGGAMEHKLVEECKSYFNINLKISLVKKLFHNKTAKGEQSGLICGGTETIIFISLYYTDIKSVSNLIDSYNNLSGGTLQIDNSKIVFHETKIKDKLISFNYKSEDYWTYTENLGFPDIIYIIGGGHIGLAVSKIMSMLDFYVIIIDPRKDVLTMTNNNYADKKLFLPYDEIGGHIIEGSRTFAVIVTYGHDTDLIALKSIIHKKLKYIGLMGSKRKIDSIFNQLIESGTKPELLKLVHTPIGVEIGAESPDEIAVSIAAEIIKVKNEKAV